MREHPATCSVCGRVNVWTVVLVCQRPSCQELAARAATRLAARGEGAGKVVPTSLPAPTSELPLLDGSGRDRSLPSAVPASSQGLPL